jgi:hypothetical protein
MSARVRITVGIGAALLLVTAGLVAVAQEATLGDGFESEAGSEIAVQRRANLSGAQQLQEAAAVQQRGSRLSVRLSAMLEEARREGDIIRVTCLNDALTQLNTSLRMANRRSEELRSAVDSGDEGRRNHEFSVVAVIGQRFSTLERDANQCVGQDLYETGDTQITTTIDPATPNENLNAAPAAVAVPVPIIPPPDSPSR